MLLKQKFGDGERVLCYHGPLLYEAKCQQSKYDEKNKTFQYLVHYSGWNKSWDEWVPESRVLAYNDDNLKKQAELRKDQKAETKTRKKKSTTGKEKKSDDDDSGETTKKQRRKAESEEVVILSTVNLKLPEVLQDKLVEDWSRMTLEKRTIHIPASKTITDLVDEYINEKNIGKSEMELRQEICEGIIAYFNEMLGPLLLYDSERELFEDINDEDNESFSLSEVYGGIHLVRCLTRLGWCMGFTKFTEFSIDYLVGHINSFIEFLGSKADSIFALSNYTSPKSAN